ncbi:hypothetical protein GZH47_33805 (plasmid) [Paenibacillus rhizovicinus]|uniref:Uncharacterized protein n=1 Tax=Paenibacillus rhizovicinus TaxID=2704463 RepID=A0A6C0PCX6_9BACL|nr:hypothetical protein [Paenibacillus rhizovicinus]QHW35632.1 hypothetical protein GZH47_32560 [Paenibacillus rhizovicinus]QHW35866.1 hypothetical protein GZH47_33805 [Paenibacillus rhizovicinus]
MPIKDTRDIVPFVNGLESKLNEVEDGMESWLQNKATILAAIPQVSSIRVQATSAIVKAEDALAELNTATYGVVAAKGQRLRKLLDDLKKQVIQIAENATGGASVPDYLSMEINNAISSVDSTLADGVKLDYRLRKIQELGQAGADFSNRDVVMPYRFEVSDRLVSDRLTIPKEENVEFVSGRVTVLDVTGNQGILNDSGKMIEGTIDADGNVLLSDAPMVSVRLYYPVRLSFKDVPEDFLMLLLETVISKSSPIMESLLKFEKLLMDIVTDITAMKGTDWTADFSIMRNQKEIVQEGITPKGLNISAVDGIVHATWSYNDHPHLSHFIAEKWDELSKSWLPFDGDQGLITK